MKHTRLLPLPLLAVVLLTGCSNPVEVDDSYIFDDFFEVETPHPNTPADFWQVVLNIEDSIKLINHLDMRLSEPRMLWYIDSLFARQGWNEPAYQYLDGGLYHYLYGDDCKDGCRFCMHRPETYRYFPIWQEYLIWKKSEAVQKELDSLAIPIDIAREYFLLNDYKEAACELLEIQVNEMLAYSDSIDYWGIVCGERAYWDEITDLYGEMLRLLMCYDSIAQGGGLMTMAEKYEGEEQVPAQYQPIDPGQFKKAFRWLKNVSRDRRASSKKVEKTYYAWMDYRKEVSRQLTGNAKELYDNATYRLQFALLIEIKNQFEHCGRWDLGGETLNKRCCSYKELLEYRGAKQAWSTCQ